MVPPLLARSLFHARRIRRTKDNFWKIYSATGERVGGREDLEPTFASYTFSRGWLGREIEGGGGMAMEEGVRRVGGRRKRVGCRADKGGARGRKRKKKDLDRFF